MRVGFFGATETVTGSCFVVETKEAHIVVDVGLYQGIQACATTNYDDLGFDAKTVDAVVLTHAHLDHVGRLPRLVHLGAACPVFATPPTRDLAQLNLEDAYHVMLEESERCQVEPLYEEEDLERAISQMQTVTYHTPTEIAPGVTATFYDAGHILGSSSVLLEAEGKRILFSGDLGSGFTPLLPHPEALQQNVDLLICEATYGDRLHEQISERRTQLRKVVVENHARNGVLLIPAFSIERTQEILFELNLLVEQEGLVIGEVFLDSPLAIETVEVFRRYQQTYLHPDVPAGFTDPDLFGFPHLTICTTVADSKKINNVPAPKVILAGSGMMNAGRIQHHLKRHLSDPSMTLLITGYQAEGTPGRAIQDGAASVQLGPYTVDVKAQVQTIASYSGHADYHMLMQWILHGQPKQVCLTHGDQTAKQALRQQLVAKGQQNVDLPAHGSWVAL